ncbi:MAG: hypothetical protein CMC57_03825 [Flavobacteriaceae bacterium]|nr:hypothetical protein [Flavobacteriaceae bacterium]|tara:strand:- start:760 stop:1017 length:258 start_codon:yes stop_codon:yes gene_type:complete
MYFNDLEEILAVVIAIAILGGFVVSTMHDMKATIAEEKQKFKEKKEAEEKAKELIDYLDTKANLIDSIVKTTKKLEKKKDNSNNV